MKVFLSLLLTLSLAVSLASPLMAKAQKGLESQAQPPIHSSSKSAATGNVSDIPMNQPECKKAGGTWSDQTLTCKRKGKL